MHVLKALVAQYPWTKFREISSKGVGARGNKAETQNCALRAQFWPLEVVICMARVPYQGASTLKVWGLCDVPCAAHPNVSPAQLWLILLATLAPPCRSGDSRGEYPGIDVAPWSSSRPYIGGKVIRRIDWALTSPPDVIWVQTPFVLYRHVINDHFGKTILVLIVTVFQCIA